MQLKMAPMYLPFVFNGTSSASGSVGCMQEALEAHQRYFVWDEAEEKGILGSIERELALRAATVNDTPRSVFS